jgi:hypothetical protein
MPKLDDPVEFRVPLDPPITIRFEDIEDLESWAQTEKEFWTSAPQGGRYFTKIWGQQNATFNRLLTAVSSMRSAQGLEKTDPHRIGIFKQARSEIAHVSNEIGAGKILTSDHPIAERSRAILSADPDVAAIMLMAHRTDADTLLGPTAVPTLAPFARLVSGQVTAREIDKGVSALRADLRKIRESGTRELEALRAAVAAVQAEGKADRGDHATFVTGRDGEWTTFLETKDREWKSTRSLLLEDLKLKAPTTYWRTRSTKSYSIARIFGIASVGVALVSLALFATSGTEHILAYAERGAFVALAPLLVPAFLTVWILKLLTRLLSDNLQLARDASERATMVETFQALMHDEGRDTELLTNEDRILVLHSLFRPSSISSVDDAPPVHWFDLLVRRQAEAAARRDT